MPRTTTTTPRGARRARGQRAPTQTQLVEDWVRRHPWSTVQEIREGISAESHVQIERVQRSLEEISLRMDLRQREGEHGRARYALGEPRETIRAAGLEARVRVVDGQIQVEVWAHGADLRDPALLEVVARVRSALEQSVHRLIVPAVVAALPPAQTEPEEEDWLTVMERLRT